jgi:large subunit ribosomal protein L4
VENSAVKLAVHNFDHQVIREIEVAEKIANQEFRPDILQRVVEWQRSRSRAGTHATKGISQISGTTRKPYKQKGTGNARHGSLRSPQFRGGAVIFGPVVRSHEYSLPKKVRTLGLRVALSQKIQNDLLKLVDLYPSNLLKTSDILKKISLFSSDSKILILYDGESMTPFLRGVANIQGVDTLSINGLNVYDLLNHDTVIISESAFNSVHERLQ